MSSFGRSSAVVPLLATSAAAIAISSFLLLRKFGVEGAIRYVWEGDSYPSYVRDRLEFLDDVQELLTAELQCLHSLEEILEKSKLESVNAASTVSLWMSYSRPQILEKDLARISQKLDEFAALIDAVPSEVHADVKLRKKMFSTKIVDAMNRTDVLIAFYKAGKDNEKTENIE